MQRQALFLSSLFALTVASGAAAATGMKVKPGLWEFTAASTLPGSNTTAATNSECFKESSIDPAVFLENAPDCNIDNLKTSTSTMSWQMQCDGPHGQMTGDAEFHSSGETAHGKMAMNLDFGGNAMSFTTNWQGRWVGPCE